MKLRVKFRLRGTEIFNWQNFSRNWKMNKNNIKIIKNQQVIYFKKNLISKSRFSLQVFINRRLKVRFKSVNLMKMIRGSRGEKRLKLKFKKIKNPMR